jgi:glycosyltransferase involved in cell wall biosynthesis
LQLSIIVPIYKAEAYLKNCVESILSQPFSDFELLLVNDASPDKSLEIAHDFERRDARVTVYDKLHSGLGLTRNFGAQRARGDYLLFVDADDWLGEDTLEKLMEPTVAEQADLVVFDFVRENQAEGISRVCSLPIACPTTDPAVNEEVLRELVGPDPADSPWRSVEMLGCAWRRLYRREWFQANRLTYPDEQKVMLEDLPVSIQAHCLSAKTLFLNIPAYHYRYNSDSLSARYRAGRMEKLNHCYGMIADFLREQHIYAGLEQRHLAWYLRQAAHSALVNAFHPGNPKDRAGKREEVREILRSPMLKRAAKSNYLKNGTRADRIIRAVLHTGSVGLVYLFYSQYAKRLQKNADKQ